MNKDHSVAGQAKRTASKDPQPGIGQGGYDTKKAAQQSSSGTTGQGNTSGTSCMKCVSYIH